MKTHSLRLSTRRWSTATFPPSGGRRQGEGVPRPSHPTCVLIEQNLHFVRSLGALCRDRNHFRGHNSSNNTSTPVDVVVAAREGGRHVTAHFGQAGQTGKSSSKSAGVMTLLDGAKERSG